MVNVEQLNNALADVSYVEGFMPSQADVQVFQSLGAAPAATYVNALRWYNHIASFSDDERSAFPAAKGTVSFDAPAAAAKKPAEDEDDIDLFGEEDPEEEAKRKAEAEARKAAAKDSKKPAVVAKSSILLDVKPYDDETDLDEVERIIRSKNINGGITWGAMKKTEIAYGLKKLTVLCTIVDDLVSSADLEDLFQSDELADLVQSMDIQAWNKI